VWIFQAEMGQQHAPCARARAHIHTHTHTHTHTYTHTHIHTHTHRAPRVMEPGGKGREI
jgi:hypothetical protein